jgi:hypothetical protein
MAFGSLFPAESMGMMYWKPSVGVITPGQVGLAHFVPCQGVIMATISDIVSLRLGGFLRE